jgi:hypothetical protein
VYLIITAETTGTTAALTGDITEVKLRSFFSKFYLTDDSDSATYTATFFRQLLGQLVIEPNGGAGSLYVSATAEIGGLLTADDGVEVTGDLTATGNITAGGANSNLLARVSATGTQSLTNNTATKITFNTASSTPTTDSYDPQAWFDNANDLIAIGQDGFYNITANIGFATNATGRRLVQIFVNGADRGSVQVASLSGATTLLSVSTNVYLVSGDYVEVFALQQSGGALNTVFVTGVYPALSVGRIGA